VLISHCDGSTLDWPVISGYAYQCPICSGMTSQAYQWNGLYRKTERNRQRRYVLKYIYLTHNSMQQLAAHGRAHLAAHGEAHITHNSRAHIVATIRGHLGDANTGQTSGQFATFKGHVSRLHL